MSRKAAKFTKAELRRAASVAKEYMLPFRILTSGIIEFIPIDIEPAKPIIEQKQLMTITDTTPLF